MILISTAKIGNDGEWLAMQHFINEGYEVFRTLFDNATCDMLVVKKNKTYRVEVKTTTVKTRAGNYEVSLKSTRPRCRGNTVKSFDGYASDLLVCVVLPTQRVHIFNSLDMNGKYNKRIEG